MHYMMFDGAMVFDNDNAKEKEKSPNVNNPIEKISSQNILEYLRC